MKILTIAATSITIALAMTMSPDPAGDPAAPLTVCTDPAARAEACAMPLSPLPANPEAHD